MDVNKEDIDNLVKILDGFADSETGRLKIFTSDELNPGETVSVHHHGRCDIGSHYARGCAYDVLEENRS